MQLVRGRSQARWCGGADRGLLQPAGRAVNWPKLSAANGWHPQLAMRGSFELFRWVPRLTLRAGYLDQLTVGVDAGYDSFVMRQMSVRLRAGWGSDEGLEGGLGLAWFPFD